MTRNEPKESVIRTTDLDGLEIEEHVDKKYTIIRSPKRVEHIRITTGPRFGQCKILYESGKDVPGLEGAWSSMYDAIRAVKIYLNSAEQTPRAKYQERWGDKPIPELKTKRRRRKAKDASSDNEDINVS